MATKSKEQREADRKAAQKQLEELNQEVSTSNLQELNVNTITSAQIVKMSMVQTMLNRQIEIHGALFTARKAQILKSVLVEVKGAFDLVDEVFS